MEFLGTSSIFLPSSKPFSPNLECQVRGKVWKEVMVFRDLRSVQIFKIDSYGHQHYRPRPSSARSGPPEAWCTGRTAAGHRSLRKQVASGRSGFLDWQAVTQSTKRLRKG